MFLPHDILTAIARAHPAACQKLWLYLENRGVIEPGPGWARELVVEEVDCGVTTTTLFGVRHSVDDLPAVTTKRHYAWYHRGKLHREGGPAVIFTSATMNWSSNKNGFRYGLSMWHDKNGREISFWLHHGEPADHGIFIDHGCWYLTALPGARLHVDDTLNSEIEFRFTPVHRDVLRDHMHGRIGYAD